MHSLKLKIYRLYGEVQLLVDSYLREVKVFNLRHV